MVKEPGGQSHRLRRIVAAGGFISVPAGSAPDGNANPGAQSRPRKRPWTGRLHRMQGVCSGLSRTRRRPCSRGKVTHLGVLPQGQPERYERVLKMVAAASRELFGSCTNIGECEAVCPKLIKLEVIARMNRDFIAASWSLRE